MTSTKKKAPRLPLLSFIGSLKDIFGTLSNAPKNYPEIMMSWLPGRSVYVINHPDLAQHVLQKNYRNYTKGKGYEVLALLLGKGLVTNDGENWHKQRTLIQPAFHRETLKRVSEIVTSSTNQLLERWKSKEGHTFNFT